MQYTRRDFVAATGTAASTFLVASSALASQRKTKKRHIVTLSFDDGFRKSSSKTAEIYEKYKLSACINVVASGFPEDAYIKKSPIGDFKLWNELQKRGHEVMPHGHRHENLQKVSFEEGKDLILRCLDVFDEGWGSASFDCLCSLMLGPYGHECSWAATFCPKGGVLLPFVGSGVARKG